MCIRDRVAAQLGLEGQAWGLIALLRWPIVFALLVLAATTMYRVGPNLRPSWRAAATGAAVFALGWLVATFAFAQYVIHVADYGATYGTLGGVVVLMIWLYLTGLILLVGAEIVAIIVQRTEPDRAATRQAEIAGRRAEPVPGRVADRTGQVAGLAIDGMRPSPTDRPGGSPQRS